MDKGERQGVTGNGVKEVGGRSDRENFTYFSSVIPNNTELGLVNDKKASFNEVEEGGFKVDFR